MAKREEGLPFGLAIHPSKATQAILLLQAYVAERVQIVEAGKIADLTDAVKLMAAINDFTETLQELVKAPAEVLYNRLRFTVVPTKADDAGVDTIGVLGVGKMHLQDDIQCKVEDKEALYKWLTDNELEDLITEQVNAQTLTATFRKRIKENLPMPAQDIVKVTPVVRAVIKRG